MAHPCCFCGSECYCNGSIDDVIVDKTPKNCEGCGCDIDDFADDLRWDADDEDDDFEEEENESELIPQKDGGLLDPETGITHYP